MRRVPAAVGRVHYRSDHELPRVRPCEPGLYDQDTRTQARYGKDDDAMHPLDEPSAGGDRDLPRIAVTAQHLPGN